MLIIFSWYWGLLIICFHLYVCWGIYASQTIWVFELLSVLSHKSYIIFCVYMCVCIYVFIFMPMHTCAGTYAHVWVCGCAILRPEISLSLKYLPLFSTLFLETDHLTDLEPARFRYIGWKVSHGDPSCHCLATVTMTSMPLNLQIFQCKFYGSNCYLGLV